MLKNSFQHLPGVGGILEKRLWDKGITDWEALLNPRSSHEGGRRIEALRGHIVESFQHIGDPRYFADRMPPALHWRFFPEFRERTAYVDIETTGTGGVGWGDEITTIALYDGHTVKSYVQGENLDRFPEDMEAYDLLVTYNGKTFDGPFIESYFRTTLTQAHIDLRYVLKSLGYGGGLKSCEKALGIDRGELEGVDGYLAVLLWNEYRNTGNKKALESLLAYNMADAVNLERLMVLAYNMKIAETPFDKTHAIEIPVEPEIPFFAHGEILRKVMGERQTFNL